MPDCGECKHCKDMLKFGGSGRSKQACVQRRCPNMAVQVAEDDEEAEAEAEPEPVRAAGGEGSKKGWGKKAKAKVEWVGEPVEEEGRRLYTSAIVNGTEVSWTFSFLDRE